MLKAGPDMLSGQKKRRNGKVDLFLSNFGEKVVFVLQLVSCFSNQGKGYRSNFFDTN